MDEYNDVAVGQATSQDGDQTTTASGWPEHAEDDRPADQEPPQGTESKQDEPASDGNGETSEASLAEPESAEGTEAASEAVVVEEAEAVSGAEAEEEAEAASEPEVVEEVEAASESESAEEAEAGPVEESVDGPEEAAVDASAEDEGAEDEGAVQEPEEAVGEAEAVTAAEEAESGTAAELTAEHLIEPDDVDRFHHEWRDVKAAFVDDPPDAVRQASVLVGEAVDGLTAALTRLRETLDGQSREVDDADTERLRLVLRGYGSLLDHILTR